MQPQYRTFTGVIAQIILLDPNKTVFNVAIRPPAGTPTVEICLEDPVDSVAPNSYTPAVTGITPTWLAAPAAVNGIITLLSPCQAVRITPSAGGTATILQQGI